MKHKVKKTIDQYEMMNDINRVIVGLSGGADSIALLHVLYGLKDEYAFTLEAIHINHQLRGQASDEEVMFCREVCQKYGISFHDYSEDIKGISLREKISIEEAGRLVRYGIFEAYLDGKTKIALGHHMNDRVETVLLNLFRGTGPKGLCGILPTRDAYIRPLIDCEKDEIMAYCQSNKLNFCTDESNFSDEYTRNKLRMSFIPYIQEHFNEQIVKSINQTALIIEEDQRYLSDQAQIAYKKVCISETPQKVILDRRLIIDLPISIRKRIYEQALMVIFQPFKDISYIHYIDIDELLHNQSGKYIVLPKDKCVRVSFDQVIFTTIEDEIDEGLYRLQIGANNLTTFQLKAFLEVINMKDAIELNAYMNAETKIIDDKSQLIEYFDYDKIHEQLVIRSKDSGDRIYLKGISGHKKMKKWFIEKKIDQSQRNHIPLLIHGDEVVWVIGHIKSDLYQVDNKTKHILKIKIEHI